MKNVIRAAPILVALALFLSVLGVVQTRSASAAVLGSVSITNAATATSTTQSYGTIGSQIGIVVTDLDLTATTTITVVSTSDSTGINVDTATTTVAGTQVVLIELGTSTSSTLAVPKLKVADGDVVTARYTDVSPAIARAATLTVETGLPSITGLSPLDKTITKATTQFLSVDVTDSVSRIDGTTIKFLVGTAATPTTQVPPDATTEIKEGTTVIGYTATLTLGLSGVNYIGVQVSDKAGNQKIFDADPDTAGNQGNKVTVDSTAPTLLSATTGNYWDTVTKTTKGNRRTSVEVKFADNLTNIDATSVAASDFAVTSNTVSNATVFGGTGEKPLSVFLTVGTEFLPDAKPKVTIIGNGVSDEAGNSLTSGEVTAGDGVAPKLTIDSISPTLAGKDSRVEIVVTSDESLSTPPIVTPLTIEGGGAISSVALTGVSTGTNVYKVTAAKPNKTGLVNVSAAGTDKATAANQGTVGIVGNTDKDTTNAVTYQTDIALPAPTILPADLSKPVTRDPFFITIDFAAEGTEYNDDTSKTVTITKLELDGTSILGQASSSDNIKFLVAVTGITNAEHTVKVNAKDAAGNILAADSSSKFTVVERAAIKIPIQPGWNLISIPGSPTDTAINMVLANNPEITAVVSYDPSLPGGFLSAVRDADGNFAGTLETITSKRGYWMLSNLFRTLNVDVAPLAAGQAGVLPPAIPVALGWNLVPVIDITGTLAAGDTTTVANTYFASLGTNLTRVYTFSTVNNQWQSVNFAAGGGGTLTIGQAYWIYLTKATVLVP